MSNNNAPMGFVSRMSNFFGRLAGQGVKDFGEELKRLTDKDRDDLVKMFNDAGLPTVPMARAA